MNLASSSFSAKGSPFTPTARQNISMKRPHPTSTRKPTPPKTARSKQIVLSTPYNYVERYVDILPVFVSEAFIFADRNTEVSARISKHGYAWVVYGRKLLIWQYRKGSGDDQQKSLSLHCYELQLPRSDLAHRAELVSVFVNNKTDTASCIAVSPEGVVRYWPSIVYEARTVVHSIDLQGQECDSLTDVDDLGCILATTTCTVVLIQPQLTDGSHSIKSKPLKVPSGWLGGISKRMSSLIFGPIPTDHSAETRQVRVLSAKETDTTWIVYVLAGHTLQKWRLHLDEAEESVFVVELNRMVRDSFRAALWENCVGDQTEIDVWLLDMQIDKDNIIVLAAAVNVPVSPRVHYAMISIQTNSQQPPINVKDFLLLKMTDLYREDGAADALNYRFLLCGTSGYLYNQRTITVIKPQEEPDTLDFTPANDTILSGSICVNTPIFFLKNYGLVSVGTKEVISDFPSSLEMSTSTDRFSESTVVNNLSIYNMDPEAISNACSDTLGQLKAAFIYYAKRQPVYKEIIGKIFPLERTELPGIDTVLDRVVVMMCKELLDDIPAADPRWSQEIPVGIGSSYTMQVLHQLQDKEKANSLFIQFLKDSGLWNRLGASTVRNSTLATVYCLAELTEKIVAAVTLKSLPASDILEQAIHKAVKESGSEPHDGLTYQDLFYREVSKVHRVIQEIVNYCEDLAHSDANPRKVVETVWYSNEMVLMVLQEILKYRQKHAEDYIVPEVIEKIAPDYGLWTNAGGPEGLADSLLQLHFLTYNYGIMMSGTEQFKNDLLEHFFHITDIILDGRKCQVENLKGTQRYELAFHKYCLDREKLIKPLLKEKDYERATKLAEKYLDFEILVQVCEATKNEARLDEYIRRFNDVGFPEFAYNWFIRENKHHVLLNRNRFKGNNSKLEQFLTGYPSLVWIYYFYEHKYDKAADTLRQLAMEESDSITKQKTMYSLAKLAKLAAPNSPSNESFISEINTQLELIDLQEDIPDYVLQEFGYDVKNLRVISAIDLINLYICQEYLEAGDMEFKKALDLLYYIVDEDLKQELNLKIWRTALLRDNWFHTELDSPLEILQNKLFFRLIEFCMMWNGHSALDLLPPLDSLLDDDSLQELKEDKTFQFLMKAGYEHIHRTQIMD